MRKSIETVSQNDPKENSCGCFCSRGKRVPWQLLTSWLSSVAVAVWRLSVWRQGNHQQTVPSGLRAPRTAIPADTVSDECIALDV
jgi:hypothetical protein